MKTRVLHLALGVTVILGLSGTAAAATTAEAVVFGLPFTLLVLGLFVYLIMRERYQRDVYRSAIEKGMPVPDKPAADYRKPALILLAVGAGYTIAITASAIAAGRWDVAAGAGVWGLIPILIGAALWRYGQLAAKGRE